MQDQTIERVKFQLPCIRPVSPSSQERTLEWSFVSSTSHVNSSSFIHPKTLYLPIGL